MKQGLLFMLGEGVPEDFVLAHMWFILSSANGLEEAGKQRDIVAKWMTSEQVAKAQRLAREWKPNKGSNKESKTSDHDFNSSPPSVKPATRSIF